MQLDPNHTYLCLGHVKGNKSLNSLIGVQIFSKNQNTFGSQANRGTLDAGGGTSCWCIVKKDTNTTANVVYLYITSFIDDSDLKYNCYLVAIALD